jgi:hypothetical protein
MHLIVPPDTGPGVVGGAVVGSVDGGVVGGGVVVVGAGQALPPRSNPLMRITAKGIIKNFFIVTFASFVDSQWTTI